MLVQLERSPEKLLKNFERNWLWKHQKQWINYTHSHLVSSGVKVLSKPVLSSEGIAKVFFCLDPDNVRVEIVEMI